MASYADRLDRLEGALAPRKGASLHVVFVNHDQTEQQAVAAYAEAHGLTVAEVRDNLITVIFCSAADGRRLTSGEPT